MIICILYIHVFTLPLSSNDNNNNNLSCSVLCCPSRPHSENQRKQKERQLLGSCQRTKKFVRLIINSILGTIICSIFIRLIIKNQEICNTNYK